MRARISLVSSAIVTMLLLGTISLVASISYNSSTLAFIGLGLVFWGATLLYVKPEEYTRKTLLEATLSPSLTTLNQMIQELGYKGDATYLPPKYFTDPETTKIYVPKQKSAILPTPEQIQNYENRPIARTTQGLLLTPPGIQLSRLMEKSLGKSFIQIDLESLQQNLPELFIENLEIAENLEIQTKPSIAAKKLTDSVSLIHSKNDTIHVKITNSIYTDTRKETRQLSHICGAIGCPICSAIAIAMTKATGKPVRITDTKNSEDGKTIEATYRVLETTEPPEQVTIAPAETINRSIELINASLSHPSNLTSFLPTAFGSIILAWIGWLTWLERTRSLALIFLEPRMGPEGLGIGMKMIYYLLIGLALLFSGLITLIRRRTNRNKK